MDNIIQESITKRKIIGIFLKYPDREFTVNELSKLSKIPYTTTWRFTQKLDKAGIVETKTIGHSTVCKLNKLSPFLKEIKKVLEAKPTPQKAVLDDFVSEVKKIENIEKVILFGSVARDEEKLTSDIDIAIIVQEKSREVEKKITEVVDDILKKSRMVIIPMVLTEKEAKENRQFKEELDKGRILYERN